MKHILVCLLVLSAVPTFAFEGTVDLSSDLYFYEADTLSHSKFYQSYKTSIILSKENLNRLSFHSYGRWRTDFQTKDDLDPQLYIYDAYLKITEYIPNSKIKLGRQFAYIPIGTALIDGIGINSYLSNKIQLKITAGAFVDRFNPEEVQSLSKNIVSIARLRYNFGVSKAGINYIHKKRLDREDLHKIGIDYSMYKNNRSLYTRGTYNLDLSQFHEFLIRGSILKDRIYISSEYLYKKPTISPNSVFAIIDAKDYKRIRVDMQYKLNEKLKLITQFRNSFFENENILGGYIGVSSTHYSIMYNFQNGQGTKNSGFSGTISKKINATYSVYGSANIYKYKIQDEIDETSESYATALGVARPIGLSMFARLEYQYLRNAVESSNQRIYFKLNKQFEF